MNERKFVKVEFASSWLEIVQMANAAVMIGLGIELSNEKVKGDAEYRLYIFDVPHTKSKSEVVVPAYTPGQSDDMDLSGLQVPGSKAYL